MWSQTPQRSDFFKLSRGLRRCRGDGRGRFSRPSDSYAPGSSSRSSRSGLVLRLVASNCVSRHKATIGNPKATCPCPRTWHTFHVTCGFHAIACVLLLRVDKRLSEAACAAFSTSPRLAAWLPRRQPDAARWARRARIPEPKGCERVCACAWACARNTACPNMCSAACIFMFSGRVGEGCAGTPSPPRVRAAACWH